MRKLKESKSQSSKGITLIALVITIIVLLILVGVAVSSITGENGILNVAKEASEKSKKADIEERIKLEILGSIDDNGIFSMDKLKSNLVNNLKVSQVDIEENEDGSITIILDGYYVTIEKENGVISSIQEKTNPGKPNENGIFQESSTIDGKKSSANNPKIPKGFKPVNDGTSQWGNEINSKTKENVGKGLIIEDEEGNQFVWIPVGEGISGTTKTIKLDRYLFDNTTGEVSSNMNDNDEYTEESKTANGKSSKGNAIAKDIDKFKESVGIYGGYYIGRYEAGVIGYSNLETNNSNSEESWTGYTGENIKMVCKANQQIWNRVTQNKASELSRRNV